MRKPPFFATLPLTRGLVAGLVVCSTLSTAGALSPHSSPRLAGGTPSYAELLQQYCEGHVSAVTSTVARWDRHQFAHARDSVRALDGTGRILAAFMHTEALEAQWRDEQGRIALEHAARATALAIGSRRFASGEEARLARMWSLALGYLYLSHLALAEADRHFAQMRRVFPRQPDLLVAAGIVHELPATPLGQRRPGPSAGVSQHRIAPSNRHRLRAATFYAQALEIDPLHPEALVRSGRMHFVAGASAEAESAFRRVLAIGNADPRSTYLAHLFLGLLYEEQQKTPAAVEQYERADAVVPNTQTAALALAALRARTGGGILALSQTAPRFDGTRGPIRSDPWSDYLFARSTRVGELAKLVRKASGCR